MHTTQMPQSDLAIDSKSFYQNPYPHYEKLRRIAPVHYLTRHDLWLVVTYQKAVEILSDPVRFSSSVNAPFDQVLLGSDPPVHTENRKLLGGFSGSFSKGNIQSLTHQVRAITEDLIGQLKGKKQFDLIADLAAPLSSLSILSLLGIKDDFRMMMQDWTNTAVSNASIHNSYFSQDHWSQLKPYLEEIIQQMVKTPQKGVIPDLIRQSSPNAFNASQLLDLIKILLVGGNETTPNLVSSAVLELLKEPANMAQVRSNPAQMIPLLLDETLRYNSPTQLVHRNTTEKIDMDGTHIPEGAMVAVSLGAANRDPDQYADPNRFDLHRAPGKIIPFGAGPHYCIGAHLARLEAIIGLEVLLQQFPSFKSEQNIESLEYRESSHIRGLKQLVLTVA